jgi:hypothetical protein
VAGGTEGMRAGQPERLMSRAAGSFGAEGQDLDRNQASCGGTVCAGLPRDRVLLPFPPFEEFILHL